MEENFTERSLAIPSGLIIRFATYNDLSQIAHIARVTWDATYNQTIAPENRREFLDRSYKPEHLADSINTPGHWFYVAELNQELIGFGHFLQRYHPTQRRAELVRLYVLSEYQHSGIGTAILKTGFEALAQAHMVECFVSVQASNLSARKFYEHHGFIVHRNHGQFLGTQIVIMVEYSRSITEADLNAEASS